MYIEKREMDEIRRARRFEFVRRFKDYYCSFDVFVLEFGWTLGFPQLKVNDVFGFFSFWPESLRHASYCTAHWTWLEHMNALINARKHWNSDDKDVLFDICIQSRFFKVNVKNESRGNRNNTSSIIFFSFQILWNILCRISGVSIEIIDARGLSERPKIHRFSSTASQISAPCLTWLRLGKRPVPLFYIPDDE